MAKDAKLAAHLPVNVAWLDLHKEEILDPDLPIIDPHHHLWDRPNWRYLFEDLLADVRSGHNIRATVYAQARAMYRADGPEHLRPVGEMEFAVGCAAMSASGLYGAPRLCAGIIAHVDLQLGSRVDEVLDALSAVGGERFKGIRQSTAWDADPMLKNPEHSTKPEMLADASFRDGFARLARRNLVFDALVFHPQLDEVEKLARAFPDAQIVVNHLGMPVGIASYADRQEEEFARWRADMIRLARCPNVAMKLGGLAMRISGTKFHTRSVPPSSEQLADAFGPRIRVAMDAFGAERCMFESNFPVDKASCSYAVLWNAFKRIASGASPDEKRMLFHDTAARLYRIP